MEYLFKREGKLASVMYESGGFFKTSPDLERPDVQMHYMPAIGYDHGRTLLDGHGLCLHVCLLRPESTGSVGLGSPDPLADPLIDLKLMDSEADVRAMLKGVKLAQKIIGHEIFKPYELKDYFFRADMTDKEMIHVIRSEANTVYHPVGTCKMGNDEQSVVDSQLRVHGVENLRVADASIMPTLIGGNTHAPAVMIGEKCADFIRKQEMSNE